MPAACGQYWSNICGASATRSSSCCARASSRPASFAKPDWSNCLISSRAIATLKRRLQRETGGGVLFDDASRGRYSTDASIYQILPVGVFVPVAEQDIARAIDIARDLEIPVLARGAGT